MPTVGVWVAAALRAAVPAPTGRTGRRSAFQAVPAPDLAWRSVVSAGFALPRDAGLEAPTGRTGQRS